MNELIKKLAREAYIQDGKELDLSWKPNEFTDMFLKDMECCFEIFAKLIVKECLERVEYVANGSGEGPWYDGYQAGVNECYRLTKEHFGVEE